MEKISWTGLLRNKVLNRVKEEMEYSTQNIEEKSFLDR